MLSKIRFFASLALTMALAALASPLSGLPTTMNSAGTLGSALAAPAPTTGAVQITITGANYLVRQPDGQHRFRVRWDLGAIPQGIRVANAHAYVRAYYVGTRTSHLDRVVINPSERTAVVLVRGEGEASVRSFVAGVTLFLEGRALTTKQFRV